ncbi:glycosyl transferase [Erythrobacter sp. KY5]|uniref:glycosyltransferase family 4 protein n=1 Tax=Erythrobacter sp. KY5 TaxID=2011159 RepID=UPI000DBEFC75|nr:glycosyltransferase family 1 protein [Erythrobacter sp. KY5]AWW73667.1 glycosyl transferase [Erythrobacter sp. KY5]
MTRVVLDISRLISRVRHARPSGVDRVEMAYCRGLLVEHGDDLSFCAVHPTGRYGRIERSVALEYFDHLEMRWADQGDAGGQRSVPSVLPWMRRLLPNRKGIGTADVMVQVSPHHLDQTVKKRDILSREGAKYVCLVHDLIPIEYPEYARPGGRRLHEARMTTVAELADAVIVNSAATGASLKQWIEGQGKSPPPIDVALLGTQKLLASSTSKTQEKKPYFLCLGTIEPRKNHLLILHLWRSMARTMDPKEIPDLVVIGRRGWENEQIVDLLDRSPALAPFVQEINSCGDEELASTLRGACALLMPSFAEGYGMPIAEALALGTPVLASDLPAHKEAGGNAPDYLDPLDGPAWKAAVLEYAKHGPARKAQLDRMRDWRAPDWSDHMKIATRVIARTAS